MAQPQHQQQQGWGCSASASAWGSSGSTRQQHRPGRLLLSDIQSLQQQQKQCQELLQQDRAAAAAARQWGAGRRSSCANELALLGSAPDPTNSSSSSTSTAAGDAPAPDLFPSSALQQQPQQQHLPVLPFWKGLQQPQQQQQNVPPPPLSHQQLQQQQQLRLHTLDPQQQQHKHPHPQQHPQQQPPGLRPGGSIGPQFASATLSGSGSGSGSDSPTALKAVGRVFGNGEICKLLGFVGAQLLMHAAHIQHSMHQLHQRQQGLSANPDQQQQGTGFGGPGGWRLRMPWQRQEGAGGAGEGAGGASQGAGTRGSAAWQAGEAAKQWVTRGVIAEKNMELREALACYTNAVTLEPGNREYLCRLAKQWSDLTYEEGATVEQIQEVNARATEYAERVVAMAPQSADGYLACCVSKGRLALFSENKTKLRLAKEAQEAARTAVEMDPRNDLAHHLMGRWHFEMAQINFVLRQLIRIVYGAALNPGTFEEALSEFQQAVAINPNKLIHRVELGRTHLRLGHKADAYQHLLASMHLEVEDINAKLQKEDAELLLAKLQAELKGRKELPASWGGFTTPGIAQIEAAPAAAKSVSSSASSSSSSRVEEAAAESSSSSSSGGAAGA